MPSKRDKWLARAPKDRPRGNVTTAKFHRFSATNWKFCAQCRAPFTPGLEKKMCPGRRRNLKQRRKGKKATYRRSIYKKGTRVFVTTEGQYGMVLMHGRKRMTINGQLQFRERPTVLLDKGGTKICDDEELSL